MAMVSQGEAMRAQSVERPDYDRANALQVRLYPWGLSIGIHIFMGLVFLFILREPAPEFIDLNFDNNLSGFSDPKPGKKQKISIVDEKQQTQERITEQSPPAPEESYTDEESSEIDRAEDLGFHSDARVPRPLTRLKKIYPEKARQLEVEAVVFLSLVIGSDGGVLKIEIHGVQLKKKVNAETDQLLVRLFAQSAREILAEAKFTPAVINGKKTPVVMDLPLHFNLN